VSDGPETKRMARGDPPPWLLYVLLMGGAFGVGGGTGSALTGGSAASAVAASEAKIIGRIDLLAQRLDAQAVAQARVEAELASVRDRIHKLELDAARGGGS
jgi:hypothetical protein